MVVSPELGWIIGTTNIPWVAIFQFYLLRVPGLAVKNSRREFYLKKKTYFSLLLAQGWFYSFYQSKARDTWSNVYAQCALQMFMHNVHCTYCQRKKNSTDTRSVCTFFHLWYSGLVVLRTFSSLNCPREMSSAGLGGLLSASSSTSACGAGPGKVQVQQL